MTRMRWPAPRNPRPRAAARVADEILKADRAGLAQRRATAEDDRAVLRAMPGAADALSLKTGIPIDRTGAALSRLKLAGRAVKAGKQWRAA